MGRDSRFCVRSDVGFGTDQTGNKPDRAGTHGEVAPSSRIGFGAVVVVLRPEAPVGLAREFPTGLRHGGGEE